MPADLTLTAGDRALLPAPRAVAPAGAGGFRWTRARGLGLAVLASLAAWAALALVLIRVL
jgi:hypothetical protein